VDLPVRPEDQRVRRPDQRGPVAHDVGEPQRRLLVRDRDVRAHEAHLRHRAQDVLEIRLRDLERNVEAADAVLPEPVAVQRRRPRMGDRGADDAGKGMDGPLIPAACP
jgi:hypothetical protein